MSHVVAVVGEGLLAETVSKRLEGRWEIIRQFDFETRLPQKADLVLALQDEWSESFYLKAEQYLRPLGIPWLSGYISGDEGIIGPFVQPHTAGCPNCAHTRRMTAGSDSVDLESIVRKLMEEDKQPHSAVSAAGLLHMALIMEAEIQTALQGGRACTEGRIYIVNLETLASSLHAFLPDPQCPLCGGLPNDNEASARISLAPSPKINKETYRCKSMDDLLNSLANTYFDERTGLINRKWINPLSPFADVSAAVPSFTGTEITAGRTHSYAKSELTAILEGVERYCGMLPRGKRTAIRDSYRNLSQSALNPVKVGVYSETQHETPDFPFEPFDPDRPIDWVWGYSFLQERPILVPESLAYYYPDREDAFVNEGSNGCAVGGSLEEAILYGILEAAERDAFLMTWYARLPVPRIDPRTAEDVELRLMVDRLETVEGYTVHLFNITMEYGIPSILAVGKNKNTTGANLICSAGAHLNPVKAAKSAVHELAAMLSMLNETLERRREEYIRMLHDPSLVWKMEDHSLLYCLQEAEPRLDFLLDTARPLRTFEEEFERKALHADLTDDLKDILQALSRSGLEVIAVDQTGPEARQHGLYCVKVLVPGLLPMSFGHQLTRLAGLERVLRIPKELGYTDRFLTMEQLNPHPHPFP